MDTRKAYDTWASQYDTNNNRTRDLEGQALRISLAPIQFDSVLEIGCGTGKNTEWFIEKAKEVTAIDLSDKMLAKAKEKNTSAKVQFTQADITLPWAFIGKRYDMVTFSLILEHIQNLDHIFQEASGSLIPGGYIYIGELHPYKQYLGTKARFDTEDGQQVVDCYNHHISEFIQIAKKHGLNLVDLNEFFDNNEKNEIPRILTIILMKDPVPST
ncbi:MAG: class I SAM-dependent methyltransferase [Ginsengibacter sp.]